MTLHDYALAYARKGIPVFPLRPKLKTPIYKGGFHKATDDVDQVNKWWTQHPNANIGVPTGDKSGLLVLDVDVKKGVNGFDSLREKYGIDITDDLADAVQQETPSGGMQYFFKMAAVDLRLTVSALGKGIDTRGNGGYAVVAGSIYEDPKEPVELHGKYEWVIDQGLIDDCPVTDIPPNILGDLIELQGSSKVNSKKEKYKMPERINNGSRNNELYRSGCSLRALGADNVEILASLKAIRDSKRTEDGFNIEDSEIEQIVDSVCEHPRGEGLRWDIIQRSGQLKGTYNNCMNYFNSFPEFEGLFKYNEFSSRIEITRRPWWGDIGEYPRDYKDQDTLLLKSYLRERGCEPALGTIDEAVNTIAYQNRYHPVRNYFKTLTWDGTKRLERWLIDYMGTKDTELNKFIGQMVLVAACARIDKPGCQYDYMVILEGAQGIGKSQAIQALSGEWYKSIDMTDRDKDTIQKMQGAWIIEVAEMVCFKRKDIESLKAFITTQVDHARFSYGRRDEGYPRQNIFIGTINPETVGYLSDKTGNRRFVPVKCGNIDVPGIRRDRDQLFAEAWALYKKGFPIWFKDNKIADLVKEEQDKREEVDGWLDLIAPKLSIIDDKITLMNVYTDILQGDPMRYNSMVGRRIGAILKKLGYVEKWDRNEKGTKIKVFEKKEAQIEPWT